MHAREPPQVVTVPLWTSSEVVAYLRRKHWITAERIVEGDLAVTQSSRRNSVFQVRQGRGACYLVKQGVGPERAITLAREAAAYGWLHSRRSNAVRYLPKFCEYDADEAVLILELLRDGNDLRAYQLRRGRFPVWVGAEMGRALSALHRTPFPVDAAAGHASPREFVPWILSIEHPPLGLLRDISGANLELIRIVQSVPEFCVHLDLLRRSWQRTALIHSDIKWDNWLHDSTPSARAGRGVKLIDWEFMTTGDPCWDTGSVFAAYLSLWLISIPVTGDTPPDRFPELAQYPLEKMQPAMRAFWRVYARQMDLDAATSDAWLLRAVRYAAARLVQVALEQTQMAVQLTGNIICFLQLGLNVLQRPEDALDHLLGMPLLTAARS